MKVCLIFGKSLVRIFRRIIYVCYERHFLLQECDQGDSTAATSGLYLCGTGTEVNLMLL